MPSQEPYEKVKRPLARCAEELELEIYSPNEKAKKCDGIKTDRKQEKENRKSKNVCFLAAV
jgi:hypothetical protein